MKNKTQDCMHAMHFYTIGDIVHCNDCHKRLGYFDSWKLNGFVKETKDIIQEEYLNERKVKEV